MNSADWARARGKPPEALDIAPPLEVIEEWPGRLDAQPRVAPQDALEARRMATFTDVHSARPEEPIWGIG